MKIDFAVGGQALIEGVMIRSPSFVTIAVRNPEKKIVTKHERFVSLTERFSILKWPILRGVITLFEMMVTGMKALNFSAEIAVGEATGEEKTDSHKSKKQALIAAVSFTFSVVFAIAFALFLFKFVPLFLTTQLEKIFPTIKAHYLLFNIIDGTLRMLIFLTYIFTLSLIPSFRRIFEYHGAEHMSVFAYEKGKTLTVTNVKEESPRHPRCGTSFIIVAFIVSILLFTLVPRHPNFAVNFFSRLAIVPFIVAIGYEILKWSAKHREHPLIKLLTLPGIGTQFITTKQPSEDQIEVAIAAVQLAVDLEHPKRDKHAEGK